MTTGAALDTRRRELGLSVAELATVIGVSERTISYWVRGDGEPRDPDQVSRRLDDVAIAMGDLVDTLCEGVNDVAASASVTLLRFRTVEALEASPLGRGLPLGAHAMAIAWAADGMKADGHVVMIDWAD